jgi:hypothetical protein
MADQEHSTTLEDPEDPEEGLESADERRAKVRGSRAKQSPPAAVARQNNLLYGLGNREYLEEEDTGIEVFPDRKRDTPAVRSAIPHNLVRLDRLLTEPPKQLKITVNGVGIHLPVIGWDLQAHALVCFVTGDVRCDLPKTNDVVIHLDGEPLRVTFLGQWHQVSWLPFQVVSFAIPDPEQSD